MGKEKKVVRRRIKFSKRTTNEVFYNFCCRPILGIEK